MKVVELHDLKIGRMSACRVGAEIVMPFSGPFLGIDVDVGVDLDISINDELELIGI